MINRLAASGQRAIPHSSLALGLLIGLGFAAYGEGAEASAYPAPDPSHRNTLFIAPYVWAPNFSGSMGFGRVNVPLDLKVQDLAGGVKAAAMGYAQYSRDQHFVYAEALGIRFSDKSLDAFFGQPVDAELTLAEFGYGQHFKFTPAYPAEGKIVVSPYLGIRYASLKAKAGQGLASLQADESWIDPALGVIIFGPLTGHLSYVMKLDGAGFGLGKDHYVSAIGALQYAFAQRWTVGLGVRSSHFNAKPGGSNDLTLDLNGTGPEGGVTYTFDY